MLTENRHGFIVDTAVTAATGTVERDAAIVMLGELPLTTRRHPFFSLLSGSLDHVEHPLDRAPGFFRNGRLNHHLVLQCFERAQDLG